VTVAQIDLDQAQLLDAVATKVAERLLGDKQWMQAAYNSMWALAERTLKSRDETKAQFEAAYAAARDKRIATIQQEVAALFNPDELRKAAREAEQRARASFDRLASEIVSEAKTRMQRTVRKAIGDLLKDRVDELLLKLVER
jgi:hypothetical protein